MAYVGIYVMIECNNSGLFAGTMLCFHVAMAVATISLWLSSTKDRHITKKFKVVIQ